jgi:hypothetical protein
MPLARQRIAGWLAALAAFGLAVAPLLHAQLHASEADQERESALQTMFQIAFQRERGPGWSVALAEAVAHALGGAHDSGPAEIEPDHRHGRENGHHGHSHGPGQHGAGSLEHLALAVHVAPDTPAVAPPERVPERPVHAPITPRLGPCYLVPDFAQGPPHA